MTQLCYLNRPERASASLAKARAGQRINDAYLVVMMRDMGKLEPSLNSGVVGSDVISVHSDPEVTSFLIDRAKNHADRRQCYCLPNG